MDEWSLQREISVIENSLLSSVNEYQVISASELIAYFDGPAPSGDTTTLNDILKNKWLFIHELVELSELKNMELKISAGLLFTHPKEVDEAHLTAMEYELKFAKEAGDLDWVNSRVNGLKAWLEDDTMPKTLRERCSEVYKLYT